MGIQYQMKLTKTIGMVSPSSVMPQLKSFPLVVVVAQRDKRAFSAFSTVLWPAVRIQSKHRSVRRSVILSSNIALQYSILRAEGRLASSSRRVAVFVSFFV
jgi:hypothetical protein